MVLQSVSWWLSITGIYRGGAHCPFSQSAAGGVFLGVAVVVRAVSSVSELLAETS